MPFPADGDSKAIKLAPKPKKPLATKWRGVLRLLRPGLGLSLVWVLGIFFSFFPKFSPWVAPIFGLSATLLALSRPSFEALVKASLVFWLYWTTFSLYLALFGWANPKNPADLAVKLALGLHLILVWTPMELGRSLKTFLSIFLGNKRASLVALGLVLILKVLPGMVDHAGKLKQTLDHRADKLSHFSKLLLLSRNLLRLESQRSDELIRALRSR